MNKRKICIIMHNDLMDYPPMISLIDIMKELGEDIIYIGHYTDSPTTRRFEELGVKLIKLGCIRSCINSILLFLSVTSTVVCLGACSLK